MQEVVEYEKLLPCQFMERLEQAPLVYIPVGALEWHCEHLAIGNDAIKMHHICCEAARQSGGIVFPPLHFGIPFMVPFGEKYKASANMPMTPEFMRNLLFPTLEGLERVGFKAAILTTGHTCEEQRALLAEIACEYQGQMHVYGTNDMEFGDEMDFNGDHAAKWETSILWQIHPELVDIYKLPKDTSMPLEGVYGDDPRLHATRELGAQIVAVLARDYAELGRKLLAGEITVNAKGQ